MLKRMLAMPLLALGLSTATATASTFRWTNDGDAKSLDPYTRTETFLLSFARNIYGPLVRRHREKVEPAMAVSWEQQTVVWAYRSYVEPQQLAANTFLLRYVTVK